MADNPVYPNNAFTQALTEGLGHAPEMGPPPQPPQEDLGEQLRQAQFERQAPPAPPPAVDLPPVQAPSLPLTRFVGIDLENNQILGNNGQVFKIPEEARTALDAFCLNTMKAALDQQFVEMAGSMGLQIQEAPDGSNKEVQEVPPAEAPPSVQSRKRKKRKQPQA